MLANGLQFQSLDLGTLLSVDWVRLTLPLQAICLEHDAQLSRLALLASVVVFIACLISRLLFVGYDDGLPTVNRRFAFEPRIFARIRWAFKSIQILDNAHEKFEGGAYRLARGDADIVILPPRFITELNKLPQNMISSRKSHSSSLTGHLNGMDVVQTTNHHVKMLLNRITPALPELLAPAARRIDKSITTLFPQRTGSWTTLEPLDKIVHCVSQAVTLATFGPPTCDDPRLVRLCFEHTRNVFSIMFVMRLVPSFLQPALVWLLPDKWRLQQSWKTLERFVVPEVERRKQEPSQDTNPDLISWMLKEANTEEETDPYMLTRLVGSVVAGGTYSSAAFIVGVIADLFAHPHDLEEIRDEIRAKHLECGGKWDQATFNGLDRLDSAMKETTRLAPGSLLVYSRVMQKDHTLSDGLTLKKGQFITVSGHSRSMDSEFFPDPKEYKALRAYNRDLHNHRARPFRTVDGEDFRWGAGRWACPGRFVASLMSKVILVKLLDEYDFKFVGGQRPPNSVVHEFVFFRPETKMMMRRRHCNSGIKY